MDRHERKELIHRLWDEFDTLPAGSQRRALTEEYNAGSRDSVLEEGNDYDLQAYQLLVDIHNHEYALDWDYVFIYDIA